MTQHELSDLAWQKFPFTYRNNRGVFRVVDKSGKTRIIRVGIPEPSGNESETDMKGGDRIGFTEITVTPDMVGKNIAVFTSIELKTMHDRLKQGQIRWHNFVLLHCGISEIWQDTPNGIEIIKEMIL